MNYFDQYSSNTYAASANQYFFRMHHDEVRTGRVFYKISSGGAFGYSLLFSNTIDSTFSDGSVSHCNLLCRRWSILGAKVGKCCKAIPAGNEMEENADWINQNVCDFVILTFGGSTSKTVEPGELFCCDEFQYDFKKGDYLCLEIIFSGEQIPYHEESLLPAFLKTKQGWKYCKNMPFASMIGCNRKRKNRIAYLGDSITQGIGTPVNSYLNWSALLSEKLDVGNAYWNLGIGYGRATDMATDGSWLYKAKHNDIVVLCCGVNDILQGAKEKQIIQDLEIIVNLLQKEKIKIVLQTIPPFDFTGEKCSTWERVNQYIKSELHKRVTIVFDIVPYLSENKMFPQKAKYGGHPNPQGCRIWAEELYRTFQQAIY